jgi:hypothetical protein
MTRARVATCWQSAKEDATINGVLRRMPGSRPPRGEPSGRAVTPRRASGQRPLPPLLAVILKQVTDRLASRSALRALAMDFQLTAPLKSRGPDMTANCEKSWIKHQRVARPLRPRRGRREPPPPPPPPAPPGRRAPAPTGTTKLSWADRAILSALARLLPVGKLRQMRLIRSPRALCAGTPAWSGDGGLSRVALREGRARRRPCGRWYWRWHVTTRAGSPAHPRRADGPGI